MRLMILGAAALLGCATLTRADSPRVFNLSTRGSVGTGADIMIAGFAIGTGSPETVLIRAVGPALTPLGVTGVLQAPQLSLFDSAGNLIQFNQGWSSVGGTATAAIMSEAGAFPLPLGSSDSAMVATLAAGTYTAQVAGANSTTGIVLLEVYEVAATSTTARLLNLSTRGEVGTSGAIMIPGLTISAGSGTRTLLIRGAGPSLTSLGVQGALTDPTLSVVNSAGATIASNDNWGTPEASGPDAAELSSIFTSAGAFTFPMGSLDSALVVTLGPGSYTVPVSGNAGATGVGLVEVYDITPSGPVGPQTVTLAATDSIADTGGTNPGVFTVSRTGDTSQPLTVAYNIGGTAVNGTDYQELPGSVTLGAYSSTGTILVTPNISFSTSTTSTVSLSLQTSTSYSVGSPAAASITIQNLPPTLYVSQIRPTSLASGSTGSGVATILLGANGSAASVSVAFSNLTSGEVVAHLVIGGDTNNTGTVVFALPYGQVSNVTWTPTTQGTYSAAQIVAALKSGNLFVEIDSSNYPDGELGGAFALGSGSTTFSAPAAPPAISLASVSDADAPRFLTQATFGATTADIATLQSQGYTAWIAAQMALPETSHRTETDADAAAFPNAGQYPVLQSNRQEAWWKISVTGKDQLRQRVAFALSEIFVTSDIASQLSQQPDGLADYYDMLANDAFGNFRTLLNDVTLSPTMGNYLNMLRNAKANAAKGTSADENYAREVQQLFTIGLNELQPDGTLVLSSSGLPVATYTQNEVVQTANVFTGWGYHSTAASPSFYGAAADFDDPMMPYASYHDTTQKTVINNVVLPAGQDAATDLKMELDALFNHPNTGPFICSQLIQRLVTSNPSPGYVYRVSQVFANDGTGTRGNLGAVVKAILTDYEARSLTVASNGGFGKLKEPLLRLTAIYRAFNAVASDNSFAIFNAQTALAEAPLRSPTVFNFFDPDYVQEGTLAAAGLLGPEFEITTASTAISVPNNIYSTVYFASPATGTTLVLDLSALSANSANPTAMVATLNQLLCENAMGASTQAGIVSALKAAPTSTTATALAQMALYLTATSPDAAIQK